MGLLLTGICRSGPPGSRVEPQGLRTPHSRPVFVENRGQVTDLLGRSRADVRFVAQGAQWTAAFAESRIHLVLTGFSSESRPVGEWNGRRIEAVPDLHLYRIDMTFPGARDNLVPEVEQELERRMHVYDALHPEGVTDLRTFSVLRYRDLYPGIDLVFRCTDSLLKYEWRIRPGADPSRIGIAFEGATSVLREEDGSLVLTSPVGMIREDGPVSWTEQGNGNLPLSVRTRVEDGIVRYDIPTRDDTKELVIDPCLHWTTFFGGEATDHIRGVETDEAENIFVAGFTASRRLPVQAGEQVVLAGNLDAFLAKYSRSGELLWSTYYGGTANEEWPSLALSQGLPVLAGSSFSTDLPLSADAFQSVLAGKNDVFLAAFDAEGKRRWATFLGGSFSDELQDLASDAAGNLVLTGGTYSTNFPVTNGVMQTSSAGDFDGFVARFSPQGQRLWASYLGGWSMDYGHGVAVDREGAIYVGGYTEGNNFPVTSQAAQGGYGGGHYDGFLAKLTSSGNKQWITLFGGALEDQITDLVCTEEGGVAVCGFTASSSLPGSSSGARGETDVFVAMFSGAGQVRWSTVFGGRRLDQAFALACDPSGRLLVTGLTESPDFPMTLTALQSQHKGKTDAFVTRMSKDGDVEWSSFFGGAEWDAGYALSAGPGSGALVAGSTSSKTFPMQGRSQQSTNAGFEDGFLVRIIFDGVLAQAGEDKSVCSGLPVTLTGGASRGREPYTYAWSPTEGVENPTAAETRVVISRTTSFILTVTDADGCMSSDTVVVTLLPSPLARAGDPLTLCRGDHAALAASVRGGTDPLQFSWSPSLGLSAPTELTPSAGPETTTQYTLTATDANGCLSRDSVLVTVNALPTLAMSEDLALCYGVESAVEASATGDHPPFTYTWSAAGMEEKKSVDKMSIIVTEDRVWSVTVTDAVGCRSHDSVRIRALPLPVVQAAEDRLICAGAETKLTASVSGGKGPYQYLWSPADGLAATGAITVQASPEESRAYRITATDKNGCASSDSVLVTVAPRPVLTLPEEQGLCSNSTAVLNLDIAPGAEPYTVHWTPSTGLSDPKIQRPEVSLGKSLRYQVTVTDRHGCEARGATMVQVLPAPIANLDPRMVLCEGASTQAKVDVRNGTAPFRYAWSAEGPRIDAPESESPTVVAGTSGMLRVTVTDAKGCVSRDSMSVTTPAPLRVLAGGSQQVCAGATVRLRAEVEGGATPYRYTWTPAPESGAADKAELSLVATRSRVYTLTVQDAAGCTMSDTVQVTVHEPPQAVLPKIPLVCHGSVVSVPASVSGGEGPLTYVWTPAPDTGPADQAQASYTVTGLGTITLTVTDAHGCTSRSSTQLGSHPALIVNAGDNMDLCEGTSAKLSARAVGGTKKYSFAWSPPDGLSDPTSASPKATPSSTITYRVMVTDGSGCTAVDTVMIRVLPKPQSRAGSDTTLCPGSELTLHGGAVGGNPPYTFAWTPVSGLSDPSRSDPTLMVETPRNLTLLVTDANGCTASDAVALAVHRPRVPRISVSPGAVLCEGDSAVLTVDAGFQEWIWSGGGTGPTLLVHDGGSWTVTTRDEHGCAAVSAPFLVRRSPRPHPAILAKGSPAFCEGGEVDLVAKEEYEKYRWSTGARTRGITVKKAGPVTLTVTSSDGCTGQSPPLDILVHPRPLVSLSLVGDTLVAQSSHSTYQWRYDGEKLRGASGPTHVPTKNGPYSVQVTSDQGCMAESRTVKINRPELRKKKTR